MYFYIYEGRLYWGRYQATAPYRSFMGMVFRNKPMKDNHWYFSGPWTFCSHGRDDHRRMKITIMHHRWDSCKLIAVENTVCHYISMNGNLSLIGAESAVQMNHFRNTFRNRLRGYAGRYLLPMTQWFRCA